MIDFQILQNGNQFSVRALTEILNDNNESVSLNLVDSLCRHYHKRGYLYRFREPLNDYKYNYTLSEKGIEQLENFLENNEYLNYIVKYRITNI